MNYPANTEIYLVKLRQVVNFELIKLDNIISLFSNGKSLFEILKLHPSEPLSGNLESSGFENTNMALNFLQHYGIFLVGIALFLGVSIVLMIVPCIREKIFRKLKKTYKKFVWSRVIQSLTFSYMNLCIYVLVSEQDKPIPQNQVDRMASLAKSIVLNFILVFYPLSMIIFLQRTQTEELTHPKTYRRFMPLVESISLKRSTFSKYYYPVTILRRWVFVAVPLIFKQAYF